MSDDSQIKAGNKVHLRPWQPGQSGNPGGRPKGLAARIRAATNDGQDLIDTLLEIQRKGSARDRMEATKILLDRGYGKAPELQVNVTANAGEAVAALADEQLEFLARTLAPSLTPGRLPATLVTGEATEDAILEAIPPESQDNSKP